MNKIKSSENIFPLPCWTLTCKLYLKPKFYNQVNQFVSSRTLDTYNKNKIGWFLKNNVRSFQQ